jgi:peptide/nickel transport system permease protein
VSTMTDAFTGGPRQRSGPRIGAATSATPIRRGAKNVSVIVSIGFVALVLIAALVPQVFTGQDPYTGHATAKLLAPGVEHWLGTDHLGRDVFARVVYGTRSSVSSALIAVAIGLVAGSLLGLLAGYARGLTDSVIGRVVDALLAIPSFLLAVIIVSALGFSTTNAAIATGISAVAVFARLMRAEVLRVRQSVFVEAAGLTGGSPAYIVFRHILPNTYRNVLSLAVLQYGLAILTIAGLAFLGYGDPPPASDWGTLVSAGKDYLTLGPWLVILPGIVIVATVLSIHRLSRLFGSR